jgi:putative tryptophan/tyrosine transport system substrate-binding protein
MDRKFRMGFLNSLSHNRKSKTRTAFDKLRPRACRGEPNRSIQNLRWLTLGTMLFALDVQAQAQQPGKVPRIGFLFPGSASTRSVFIEAFRQGLRDLGYIEGKNITVEYRYAEGKMERLPDLAAELVRLKVDVIVAGGGQAIRAAKQATTTIPIVFPSVGDPVAFGLVASLARPGGNITGLTLLEPELSGKRLELLKEALPRISRVAVLQAPGQGDLKETQTAGRFLGLKLQFLDIKDAAGVETVFSAMSRERADAFLTLVHPVIGVQRKRILEFAAKNRLPGYMEIRSGRIAVASCPKGRIVRTYSAALPSTWTRF